MAGKMHKLTKDGQTIYPATTTDAVVHPDLGATSSELIGEVNVSKIYPTGGIGGSNKYTLETAIAMIPASLRSVGIKCSFLDEEGTVEEWVYQGGTFILISNWRECGGKKMAELENITSSIGYYECTSEANSAQKTLSIDAIQSLTSKIRFLVKMVNENTIDNVILKINLFPAKPLFYNNKRVSANNSWKAGEIIDIYYDGESFYSNNSQGGGGLGNYNFVDYNGTDEETRLLVGLDNRKIGYMLGYKKPAIGIILETYNSTEISDDDWRNANNWSRTAVYKNSNSYLFSPEDH